MISFNKIALG